MSHQGMHHVGSDALPFISAEAHKFTYESPRPELSVDVVVVSIASDSSPTPKGCWALPGAFVEDYESFFIAARRVLVDQTTLGGTGTGGPDDNGGVRLTSVAAFGDPARDPRGWAVSISFAGLVAEPVAEDVVLKKPPTSSSSSATAGGASAGLQQQPQKPHFGAGSAAAGSVAASSSTTVDSGGGSSAAGEAAWFPIDDLPKLAFDAYDIIGAALHVLGRAVQVGDARLPGGGGGEEIRPDAAERTRQTLLESKLASAFRKKTEALQTAAVKEDSDDAAAQATAGGGA